MPLQVFSNNGSSLLASSILATDLSVTVTAGEGAKFPIISAGQVAICVLEDNSGNIEVVRVTGRTIDTMTIVRAQENTTALAFASGSRFECRPTAGVAASFLQKTGGDTLSGTTAFSGILTSTGSIQGGEVVAARIRGAAGDTSNEIFVPTAGGPATEGGSVILTKANLTNQLVGTGTGLMITGMVCFWTGASNAIPAGYTLCDGTAGTPDLRDQFILCGGGVLPTTGGSSSTTTGSGSLGAFTVTPTALDITQLPAHTHNFWGSSTLNYGGGGSVPSMTVAASGGSLLNIPNGAGGPTNQQFIQSAGSGATHTHAISGSTAHTHTYTLPPYRALFAIMKT